MKRNKFIAALLTVVSAPIFVFSQLKGKLERQKKGFKILAGEVPAIKFRFVWLPDE